MGLQVAKHNKRNQRLHQHGCISDSDKEKLEKIQGLKSEKAHYHIIDDGGQNNDRQAENDSQ